MLNDKVFLYLLRLVALIVIALLGGILYELVELSLPALKAFGASFLVSQDWDQVQEKFGALSFIYGTVVTSLIALILATPVSVGAALLMTEVLPKRVSGALGILIELLAAIPSVVYGLWGIFLLAPFLRTSVQPALSNWFGFLPLFQGPAYGLGILAAGIILAIMIAPTITALSREVFLTVPKTQRESALALGATRWEMIRISVLSPSKLGVVASVVLGLGRALGETMAVTMIIGNRAEITSSLFSPGSTMASVIANEYAEAGGLLHPSALALVGLSLFLVSLIIHFIARGAIRLNQWRGARR